MTRRQTRAQSLIDCTGKDQSWWPDLSGQTIVVVGAGPSLTQAQCDRVAHLPVIAINESWRLIPQASWLYACDWQWWQARGPDLSEYRGLRIVGHLPPNSKLPKGLKHMERHLRYAPVFTGSNHLQMEGHRIGSGSNSGFQAFNLAVRWKAGRIILLGMDCRNPNEHWHGKHDFVGAGGMKDKDVAVWHRSWQNAARTCEKMGIQVENCTPGSAIKSFRKRDLCEVVPCG